MFYTKTTFIGIDPTAGDHPFVYAALDHELRLLALGQGSMEDILAFAAGQHQAVAAVCAPRLPNQGLMARPEIRQDLTPAPTPGRWLNFRLADYLLRQRRLSSVQTPAEEEQCPRWMRNGFLLYRRLEGLGYQIYPHEQAELQCLEVYPHACYAALLGKLPFPKHSLEGRIQRQLVLYENRLNVPDPMRIFEEITRHRILKGVLELDNLYTPGELDALVAAYTAHLASNHPDQVTVLGDPREGEVVLPAAELKGKYS
ncbi:MAG: DUF429 domain-containing protein [Anaerolineales bacterium]|nr:DUF429 domain-containing protein [Anaerolineales bacterium]